MMTPIHKMGRELRTLAVLLACALAWTLPASIAGGIDPSASQVRTFAALGTVEDVQSNQGTIVIRHEAITNYMSAMTMPFKVREPALLLDVHRGDQISFELHVTDTQSWIDQIQTLKAGDSSLITAARPAEAAPPGLPNGPWRLPFTNELGQTVTLGDFRGQALAITFFYTRCPLPEYCPRLSKNFAEASEKLLSLTNAPSNWHLFSVSFDPQFDTPEALKTYAGFYHYDAAHWSFLTGTPETIRQLAEASGVTYEPDNGTISHNFRTLIIDSTGHLQMIFPIGGDLSDQIVDQLLKASTNTQGASAKK
jgi:protein SCO1/2